MKRGWAYISLVSVLIAAAILLRYFDPFFVRALRLIAFDGYQRLNPEQYDPNLPIRIVDIDEQSLTKIGQWPWPRTTVTQSPRRRPRIEASGGRCLRRLVRRTRSHICRGDRQATAAAQASLLLTAAEGAAHQRRGVCRCTQGDPERVVSVSGSRIKRRRFQPKAGFAVAGQDPRPFILNLRRCSKNLALLDDAAHGIGAFNWTPDRDQIVRRVALIFRIGETFVPSLAAEALRVAQGARTYFLKASNASGENRVRASPPASITSASEKSKSRPIVLGRSISNSGISISNAYIPAWKVLAGEVTR